MNVTPYIFFPGTCAEAMAFYAETLGAEPPDMFLFRDMPEEDKANMPGMSDDAVMNASLSHGDLEIMASDGSPEDAPGMAGVSIHLAMDSIAEAHRVFEAFARDGSVGMPMQETFWTPAFGTVRDRYGTRWMVSVVDGAT